MNRSHRQNSTTSKHNSSIPSSSEQVGACKDVASVAYDEYLWLLQKRNRLLKRLKTKDDQQVALEKKEKGFSLYINGANRELSGLNASRRTKTADDNFSSRKVATNDENLLNYDTNEGNRAKTAPTKLTRKTWRPVDFRMKTEQGEKVKIKIPGNITGVYSEDFDNDNEEENSENDEVDSNDNEDDSNVDDSDSDVVEELNLSFNDVHTLRRSLEKDNQIFESIQTVIECDSSSESESEVLQVEESSCLHVKDLEDNIEDERISEEIEEEVEIHDYSINVGDTEAFDGLSKLRGSFVIHDDTTDESLRSARPVIQDDTTDESLRSARPVIQDNTTDESLRSARPVIQDDTTDESLRSARPVIQDYLSTRDEEEETIVLSFSKKKPSKKLLLATRKSDDHNNETESCKISNTFKESGRKLSPKNLELDVKDDVTAITDETVALVTKKVRNMNASQQRQLLDLLTKLDPSTPHNVHPSSSTLHNVHPSPIFHDICSGSSTHHDVHPSPSTHHDIHPTSSTSHNVHPSPSTHRDVPPGPSTRHDIHPSSSTPHNVHPSPSTHHEVPPGSSTHYDIHRSSSTHHDIPPGSSIHHDVHPSPSKAFGSSPSEAFLTRNHINDKNVVNFIQNKASDEIDEKCSDIMVEYSQSSHKEHGPLPIRQTMFGRSSEDNSSPRNEKTPLPKRPPWLDGLKKKRSSASNVKEEKDNKCSLSWLRSAEKKDASLQELFEQPKPRSRPSSGRRSCNNPASSGPRGHQSEVDCGRRPVEQHPGNQDLELHENFSNLCVGKTTPNEKIFNERWLEESLDSLSQFKRCHQGRLTPSMKINMDHQGDALDEFLVEDSQIQDDAVNLSVVDDFTIPELPRGQTLVINILTTWGDQYYVGLNGVEIFNSSGKPVQISSITAEPCDINVLQEYNKDPRVVSNLIDGVYFTRDDMHLWLAPFTEGRNHFIYIEFKETSTLAMIRLWNYNKSRIHSFRGARDIEIFLDDNLIFRGEVARASGELGTSETFGDTILFTMNDEILEAMALNDQTYEPDVDDDEEYLQSSSSFQRPVTADTGHEHETYDRPFTCPKERKKPRMESTYPNKVVKEQFCIDDVVGKHCKGEVLELNFVETWGDLSYLGLTGLQLFDTNGEIIHVSLDMMQASPRDLNDLPEYDDDDRTLDKLIDSVNVTTSDEYMWLIPFTLGEDHTLSIHLKERKEIAGLYIWNYNKSLEGTYRGVKWMIIKLDGRTVGSEDGILIRKAPGHCYFDYRQEISFLHPPKRQETDPFVPTIPGEGDCELTVKPSGFIFQFQLFESWGDPYYLGLNGLEFYDQDGRLMELNEKNITAYPESVNVLEGVKDDVRTPAKLIDGVNDTEDGRHMWLVPIFPDLTNLLYVIFDEPKSISMIKIWNYRKTPIRGVRRLAILVDDLLVFNGILPQVPTGARGILPNMNIPLPHASILFTDDEAIQQKERPFAINGGGFFESHEVCLMNDRTDFEQEKTVNSTNVDQALRPKTSVTQLYRAKR
ncbi:katanin-interacting protein-like isoform X3 [Xenia sp. Carnegie-2017]|uniref:katanin-interacting protein-like isoform X3 n=1 Tax=Xenia sp. Carnegie-2017 TaxID=2897299 RepID=UPI001F0397F7|nr:katanin-interacting protein-like isoform X3 [Xenia sp. Carnegie-2017]